MSPTPKTYRKRPVTIEAMEFGPAAPDAHALTSWMGENLYPGLIGNATEPETLRYPDQEPDDDSRPDKGWYIDPATGLLVIRTLEGDMTVSVGDYVIRGVEGEFYPCKPGIFAATYEESPEAPPTVHHHLTVTVEDGEPHIVLTCDAPEDADCRRRPLAPDIEEWGPEDATEPGHACWATDWIDAGGLIGLSVDAEGVIASVPVSVCYEDGVSATPIPTTTGSRHV